MDQEFLDLSGINTPRSSQAALCAEDFPILKDLSPLSLRILNDASRTMHVSKGVELIHEGDAPHDLYFIKSGKMSIAKQHTQKVKILATLSKGEVYGEFGILRQKSRFASAYTAEASEVIRVELSAVQQVLDADPHFKTALNKLLSQRMLDSFFFSHPVFKSLPEDTRIQISKDLPVHFYSRNSRLFAQGEKPQGIFLVLSGEVEVHYLNRNRHDILLEIRRDNDLVGELASKNGTSLAYSAIAASDLDALLLDNAAMKIMHDHHPETFKKLENYINTRASRTAERLKESNHQTDI
ncbi:MAG: cyclic nucleotide-binding domain-containing protein [Mariprofundaceae bacterium]|nr:cyclic nucleotide-binding domain-containing protein [Mariprofundaceae bacterium]